MRFDRGVWHNSSALDSTPDGARFESRSGYLPSWLWFSSVRKDKFRDITSITSRPILSRSFLVHHSFTTFDALHTRQALEPTQPPIRCVAGALSPWGKQSGREADHSPPSDAELKNLWSYTSAPSYVLTEWCLNEFSK
jgi:hypothetical protein